MPRRVVAAAFFLALAGAAGWGQGVQPSPVRSSSPLGGSYASGERSGLEYAGSAARRNFLSLSLAQETAYDDNVWDNNALRQSDAVFGFGGRLALQQQRARSALALDYRPDLLLYRETSARNTVSHAFSFDLNYQPSPQFGLRLRDSLSRLSGVFHPRWSEELVPAMVPPASLNTNVFTPLTTMFENNARVDAAYHRSRYTSFNFFAAALERRFREPATGGPRLRDSRNINGGVQYLRQLTAADALGALYSVEALRFSDEARARVHSAFLSFAHQWSPNRSVEVFGGPQYAQLRERFTQQISLDGAQALLVGRISGTRLDGGLGAVFSERTERAVWQVSARRTVTDGGGLLSAASNVLFGVSVQRRLTSRWQLRWTLEAARTAALGKVLADSRVQSQGTGLALERSLGENLSARLAYNFLRQRGGGPFPLAADLNRNRVSFAIFYRLRAIPLGR